MLKAFWRWVVDFPRPTWEARCDEGRIVFFRRRNAQEAADEDNKHGGWPGDPVSVVTRGDWMRPSEIDALP
jgi:hypothetical protein